MASLEIETKEFDLSLGLLEVLFPKAVMEGMKQAADEALRLSSFEVPHDVSTLEKSGNVQYLPEENGAVVGYDTRYAARLHEHPEYKFQKGRKGKYLEDPIKNNITVLRLVAGNSIKNRLFK
jgi:hypothetical protein